MQAFHIKCNPPKSTAQSGSQILMGKGGKRFIGRKKNSKAEGAKHDLMLLLSENVPDKPHEGPVRVLIVWAYPWRKSEPKKNRVHGVKYCDTRPDIDNLCKMLFDSMTRLAFWNDDSQVASLAFKKIWSDEAGISIKIIPIEEISQCLPE